MHSQSQPLLLTTVTTGLTRSSVTRIVAFHGTAAAFDRFDETSIGRQTEPNNQQPARRLFDGFVH